MALIKCPECSKDVSTSASACPHCGYPLKNVNHYPPNRASRLIEKEHDRKYKQMIAGGIISLIAAVGFLMFLCHPLARYDAEFFTMIIGSSIGFGIAGIILLAIGIRRLKE